MTANTQKINAKSVVKYMVLPGIIPRAKAFAGGGFGYLAFLIASIYRSVRILPPSHPFVDPANIGKFGIVSVIAAAAANMKFTRNNIDQIFVFCALLLAMVLLVLQFVLLLTAFFSGQAFAAAGGGENFLSIFVTQQPQIDVAFLMLDYVFGLPSAAGGGGVATFFGSNALVATGGPTTFHQGLHALFNFYNLAILLVGVLIFIYYVIVVVIETAQTGVPFGRRFSKIYAPLRLVVAIGMLVPLSYGFNGAQYITLWMAKIGSSFATNGWLLYNENLSGPNQNPSGSPTSSMIARPRTPYIDELMYFSTVYHACRDYYGIEIPVNDKFPSGPKICINAYIINNGQAQSFTAPIGNGTNNCQTVGAGNFTYQDAKRIFGQTELEIVLGEWGNGEEGTNDWKEFPGSVNPFCGKMTVSLSHDNPATLAQGNNGGGEQGVRAVEETYFQLTQTLLNPQNGAGIFGGGNDTDRFQVFGERIARSHASSLQADPCYASDKLLDADKCLNNSSNPEGSIFVQPALSLRGTVDTQILTSYNNLRNNLDLTLPEDVKRRGWGGAGIWFNNIADLNGTFSGAVYATPSVRQMPTVMEETKKQKQGQDNTPGKCETFTPNLADFKKAQAGVGEYKLAEALNEAYHYFCEEKPAQHITGTAEGAANAPTGVSLCGTPTLQQGGTVKGGTGNVFQDVMGLIFGLNGLFDIRACSEEDPVTGQPKVNPLAQLSTIGKSLIENAIRSMGVALGASFGGGMLGVLGTSLGPALQSISGMFVGIATIGLTIGFVLFYVLPMLPFIYFFFAVGAWVKSIFEAMVGVPLWALAHLHIDGDGLPGRAAMGGYFLIFEIFLRPIATVFGLIGGMAIFSALTIALNVLFDLVTLNSTSAISAANEVNLIDNTQSVEGLRRGMIDQFFFTIMYTILVYLMATSCFKMIDRIPEHFMNWLSTGVSTFNDAKGDATGELTKYASAGGNIVGGQVFGGLSKGFGGLGQGLGTLGKAAMESEKQ